MSRKQAGELRRGWTTGACATAATKAAYVALLTGAFPDPVGIALPRGRQPSFALAKRSLDGGGASAGVIKDAGDDPDVTHGALIVAEVRAGDPGAGVVFRAGSGVGTVTRPGLPLKVGEPAINPAPRAAMRSAVAEVAALHGAAGDVEVRISVPGGEALAERTWNPRLGIVGGISILGTTGVVVPYSCSAWIASIRRGIDVARAAGEPMVAGCTGAVSEERTRELLSLPEHAMIDMGDFAGGMLKYLRARPVPHVYVAGGFAKMAKLAQGALDLHSSRSRVDFGRLAALASGAGANEDACARIRRAGTAAEALALAPPLGEAVAREARRVACEAAGSAGVGVLVFDRAGNGVGRADA